MLPENNSAPGLVDIFLWIGTAIGGFFLAKRGYNSAPKRQEQFSVAGAIVDNNAIASATAPLLAAMTALTEAINKNSALREEEREEEARQRQEDRFELAVEKAVSRAAQMMRDNPPAAMPPFRRDPAE